MEHSNGVLLSIAKERQCKLTADLARVQQKEYDLMDKVLENERLIRSLVAKINWQHRKNNKK